MSSLTSSNPHNWGYASARDKFISGAARPGKYSSDSGAAARPPGPPGPPATVTEGEVEEWAAFVKQQGVKRVLCLLTGSELLSYNEGGLLAFFTSHFDDVVTVSDLYVQGAGDRVLAALQAAEDANEQCVVHCSAGQGRTGVCLALWLHKRYKMTIVDAVAEVTSYAEQCGSVRRPTVTAVQRVLGKDSDNNDDGSSSKANSTDTTHTARPPISGESSSSSRGSQSNRQVPPEGVPPITARGAHTPRLLLNGAYGEKMNGASGQEETPRSSRPLPKPRIAFVQTGGTIDKEYPQSTHGYAFEIAGDCPAARRVLKDASHVPLGFHAEFHEVCRKDSTELEDRDRAKLASTLANDVATNKIIVTHGSDTMIETAEFLSRDHRLVEKTIVLTGSMRPQKFRDTDAAFNIGVAVGSVHVLPAGVYVAMGGAVISHERCRRDMKTGAFVAVP